MVWASVLSPKQSANSTDGGDIECIDLCDAQPLDETLGILKLREVAQYRETNEANRRVPAGEAGRPPDTGPVERGVRPHLWLALGSKKQPVP